MKRTIKRYANRKLYDTADSRYVSLQDILELVRSGEDVEVIANRSGEDLTGGTLAQAIAEEERAGGSALPLDALKELIKWGSDSLDAIVRKSKLAGKGAVQMAEESASKHYRELVNHGAINKDHAGSYLKLLSGAVAKRRLSLENRVDERVRAFVERMDLPSGTDFDRVAERVDAIVEKLDAHIAGSRARGKKTRKAK